LSNKGSLKIDAPALKKMLSYRQDRKRDSEAGGVLLGRFIIDSKEVVVDKVSVPMIGDKRTRYSFHRDLRKHQLMINREWENSSGTCHYLGEWHTHPEPEPSPSDQDLTNWKNHLKRDHFSSRYLYFVIVGTEEVCLWEGDRRTLKIKKLDLVE
jgi:integrative and conjugative element protein (TIGR02256 family)